MGWRIIFFLLIPCLAFADNTGVSYIGMKHKTWPCERSLQVFDKAPVINLGTLLDDTFGKKYECIERALKYQPNKERVVRFHAANCTCFPERGRKCHKDEIFAGMTQKEANKVILSEAKKPFNKQKILNRLRVKLAKGKGLSTTALMSPCLESGLSRQARKVMLDVSADYFPKAQLVDNPFGDSCIGGYVCEIHGDKSGQGFYTVDLDGVSFNKIDLTKFVTKNKQAIFALLWEYWMNCIDHHNPNFVSPPLRKCEIKEVIFDYVTELLKKDGMIPTNDSPLNPNDLKACKKKTWNGLGDALWKQSDTHLGAVFVHPKRFSSVKLKKNGVTQNFTRAGQLASPDNRYIFRGSKSSWQLEDNSVIVSDGNCFVIEEPLLRKD